MVAQSYCALGTQGQMIPHTAFEIGHQYADKALELDDTIAEGHIAKAMPYLYYEWKWQDAYDSLQKAIELNPGAVAAYDLLGFLLYRQGTKAKAVKVLEEAEQIDPSPPPSFVHWA